MMVSRHMDGKNVLLLIKLGVSFGCRWKYTNEGIVKVLLRDHGARGFSAGSPS